MREFSDEFLDAYLDAAGPAAMTSVGGYQLENIGITLFERIDGDHFTILGLPMFALLNEFRRIGALATSNPTPALRCIDDHRGRGARFWRQVVRHCHERRIGGSSGGILPRSAFKDLCSLEPARRSISRSTRNCTRSGSTRFTGSDTSTCCRLNASPDASARPAPSTGRPRFAGRPAPNVIKAVVGEDWIIEKMPSGDLKFVLYTNTFHHPLPDSAPLAL